MLKPLALIASLASAVLALVMSQTAFAATSLYSGLGQGWDVSYPQCPNGYVANANQASFGIAGIDHGRPFDVDNQYGPNGCLTLEYSQEPAGTTGLYMNTGYTTTYYKNHQVASCVAASRSIAGKSSVQQAWEIGCAFAWFNEQYVTGPATEVVGNYHGLGLPMPSMWWLDVETGNSWSSSNKALNAEALQGAVDELTKTLAPGTPVGVYSTPSMWSTIVGSNPVSGVAADWVATGATSAPTAQLTTWCADSFSRDSTGAKAPVWLVQWVWQNAYDYDLTC